MADIRRAAHLSAPRLSELRLQSLVEALAPAGCRTVLARFLDDPWELQGNAEYYAYELDVPFERAHIGRLLSELRHGGWLHQRPAGHGLVSRLRRDELELRFPDTMRFLHAPARRPGARGDGLARLEDRLRRLSR